MDQQHSRLQKRHISLIALGFLGFIIYSLYLNGFGTNAPVMMRFYEIDAAQQGFILTMQAFGSLAALIFIALHGERYNKINAFFLGMMLFGVGSITLGLAPPYFALIFLIMLCGVGLSTADAMMNGIIPELFPKQKNTLLPLLHAFFGLGAMCAPIFFTVLVNPNVPSTFTRPFLLIGALLISFSIVFVILTRRLIPETPYADMTAMRKRVAKNPAEIFKSAKAWLFLLAGTLHFSFATGIISWLPTYCQEIGIDFNTSGTILTMFFVGSLVMRFCGPLILKKINPHTFYIIFTLIAASLATAALLVNNVTIMIVLLVCSGFMQGSNVALLVLMCTSAFPQRIASASAVPFMAASISSMTAPLWMGAIAEQIGFQIPLLMICAMLALSVVPILLTKAKNEINPNH